jgi:hypothetical protein
LFGREAIFVQSSCIEATAPGLFLGRILLLSGENVDSQFLPQLAQLGFLRDTEISAAMIRLSFRV